jgi:hypothetical protein
MLKHLNGRSLLARAMRALTFVAMLAVVNVPAIEASQNATVLPNTGTLSGLTMVNTLNGSMDTIISHFSGASAPSSPTQYQFWADTTNSLLKIYVSSSWLTVGSFAGGSWVSYSGSVKETAPTTTGSANAYVLTYSPAPAALVTGQTYTFITNFSNTGAVTLNINSLGAIAITKQGNTALVSGDLASGQAVSVVFDGTQFQMTSPTAVATVTNFEVPVRQATLGSPVDSNGFPTFLPATSASLSITSQNVTSTAPLVVAAANGYNSAGQVDRVGITISNITWSSLTASSTVYLYVDVAANGTLTTGSTTLQPVYQSGGGYSVTNGQFTFNIQQMSGQVGNGSTSAQAYRVFVGEVVTGSSTVTGTIAYALMGQYVAPWTNTLPGTATKTSFNHNIGINDLVLNVELKNLTAEGNYSVGDVLTNIGVSPSSGVTSPIPVAYQRNTCWFTTGVNGAFNIVNATTGAGLAPTAANWAYRMTARRRW